MRLGYRQLKDEFERLCEIEPALKLLYEEAKRTVPPPRRTDVVWERRFKSRLVRLVGWHAAKEELRTSAAYELAYRHIHRALFDHAGTGGH